MTTLILNKIPDKLSFKTKSIDFEVFIDKLVEYMQDLEDTEVVKKEIQNDDWYRVSLDNFLKNV